MGRAVGLTDSMCSPKRTAMVAKLIFHNRLR